MASLTLTPNPCRLGDNVTLEGLDFAVSTNCTITVLGPLGKTSFQSQITSDASGEFASTDLPNYATTTYTLSANVAAADTITLGAVTYTWRASVGTTANEVLVGGTASASLDNLKSIINLDGNTAVYGSATTVHPTVRASAKTATTLLIVAKSGGTGGNSITSTKVGTNGSFTGGTLAGGAAASGNYDYQFQPTQDGIWTVTATDGSASASAKLTVITSA